VELKSQQKQEILFFSALSQLILWPIQTHIWQVPGALTLVIKQQWYESENSLPHSAKVKNEWIYKSTPPYMPSWCVPGQLEVTILWNYYGWVVTILRTCGYDHNCIESSSSSTKCVRFTKTKFATRVIPKVMSTVTQLATLQHQTIEYCLVGGASCCHIFEWGIASVACIMWL